MAEPDDRVVRIKEVCRIVGLSRASIYKRIAAGDFPQRIRLGDKSVGWWESEVRDWVEARRNSEEHHG